MGATLGATPVELRMMRGNVVIPTSAGSVITTGVETPLCSGATRARRTVDSAAGVLTFVAVTTVKTIPVRTSNA